MGRLSSSVMSQMVVVGLVVGAVPYSTPRTEPTSDATPHRTVLTSTPSIADLAAEERYLALAVEGAEAAEKAVTVEEAAIALAGSLAAVPVSAVEGATSCPTPKLTVSWAEPGPDYVHGALVTPLGPAPGPETDEVNGVVICEGYPYAFMGFEARRVNGGWDVVAVPYIGGDDGHEPANDDADHAHEEDDHGDAPSGSDGAAPRIELPDGDLGPIEGYAKYEPQRICHASAKPGTDAMKRLLLGRYPMTRNLGIVRGCSIGGRSEHKEGRAFDWGAYASRSGERAAVEDMIDRMLATDAAGNRHALARRMGVMYIIWNQRIWSAYRYDAGWRPYNGRSPHTDHAHISLSWDGAMGRTSFWNANGVEAMLATPVGAAQLTASAPDDSGRDTTVAADRRSQQADPSPSPSPTAQEREAQRHARRDARREEYARRLEEWIAAHQEEYEARSGEWSDEQREEYERRLAEWRTAQEQLVEDDVQAEEHRTEWTDEQREEYARRLAEWRAAQEQAREERDRREAAREEERERRREARAQRETDRATRRAEWEAERERRQQAREQRETERRAEWEAERERRQQAREQRETERRAEWEAERERRQQAGEERDARRQAERERRQQAREQRDADRRSRWEAERERRQQAREERDARRQAERERRQQAREERDARRQAERERRQQAREEREARRRAEREERRRRDGASASPSPTETAPVAPAPTETAPATPGPTETATSGTDA